MKLAPMIMIAAAVALAPSLAGAAQSNTYHHKRHVVRVAQPEHIACTKYGCFPVAPNCIPHTQLDWWGNPTGYDAISCR